MMSLPEDLAAFYEACETHIKERIKEKTERERNRDFFRLEKSFRELYTSIKHRTVESLLTPTLSGELESFIVDLLYDTLGEDMVND